MVNRMKPPFAVLAGSVALAALAALALAEEPKTTPKPSTVMETLKSLPEQPAGKVVKTEEEWKKSLTPEQYHILREAGTERADGQVYREFKEQGEGTYVCAGCGAELFSSKEKFDSHCGWPSFYDPAQAKNVEYKTDYLLGYARTEVRCAVCGGHLGHVFNGEGFKTPTDKRYCINGTVLKFVPKKAAATEEAKAPKPKE
jgi:peptide-methionine (R)-S-oxide reductase